MPMPQSLSSKARNVCILIPWLFQYNALLRLPDSMPIDEKRRRAEEIVDALDIRKCLKTSKLLVYCSSLSNKSSYKLWDYHLRFRIQQLQLIKSWAKFVFLNYLKDLKSKLMLCLKNTGLCVPTLFSFPFMIFAFLLCFHKLKTFFWIRIDAIKFFLKCLSKSLINSE